MPPLTNDQIQELAIADKRVASDSAGAATDTNAGDVANLDYAGKQIGASNIANIQSIAGIGTGEPISDGTDVQRDTYNANKQDITTGIEGAESNVESSTSVIDRLQAERDSIMKTTSDDLAAINDAGKVAGAQFDAAITQAEEARKTTLASDVVRAGSRGGFENTQMAGIAALKGTDPTTGEAFVGAGGQLDQLRQKLDMNISMLKDQQRQAIAAARAAERKYIKTGKQEHYNDSVALVKLSNDMENDKTTLQMQKENLKINQAQEARQGAAAEFDMISQIPAGITMNIGGKDYTGIAVEEIEPFYTSASITSLMKDLPVGETKKIYDPNTGENIVIEGWKQDTPDTQIFKSTNQNTGDETYTTIDKNTGEPVKQWVSKGTGSRFKPTVKSTTNKTDRLLSLAEQKAYGMGAGKTLQDAIDANKVPEDDISETDSITADVTAIMGEDTKLDTSKYNTLRRNVAQGSPNLLKWFDENYPPTKWLNPNDPKAEEIIDAWQEETGIY